MGAYTRGVVSKKLMYLSFLYYIDITIRSPYISTHQDEIWKEIITKRNQITKNFQPLRDNDDLDIIHPTILYGPGFGKNEKIPKSVVNYQGNFYGGVSPDCSDDNYTNFWLNKWPTAPSNKTKYLKSKVYWKNE